jgi:NADPH:quinone reductase-like Zn-dependent oxidoreductase
MTASRVNRFGPPDVITIEQMDVPSPGDGEVLVRVKAAGVGPWDAWIRAGKSALPQPLPLTLGSDLSGTIAAMGKGVVDFAPGDAVFGVTNPRFTGSYAEFAIAQAGMIAKKPAALDDVDAASLPVVAVTAWQALFEQAKLVRGQTVLIHGGGGNVGAYAAQIAHGEGIRVIATAGTPDVEYVRSLGADQVVDYRKGAFETAVEPVDAVLDFVGGQTQARSLQVLRRGGALISAVSPPDRALAEQLGVRASFFLVNVTTQALQRIAALIDTRKIATNVGSVLPLASARIAHEMVEGARSRPRGKIVLRTGA